MKALGRPSSYKPEYCEMVIEHMKQGLSIRSFCAVVDIHEDTAYEWIKVHPDFSEAVKKGRQQQIAFFEKTGIAAAHGKIPNFNAAAYIWLSKNMIGWRDKVELSGDENKPIHIHADMEKLPSIQLKAITQKLLGNLNDPNPTV